MVTYRVNGELERFRAASNSYGVHARGVCLPSACTSRLHAHTRARIECTHRVHALSASLPTLPMWGTCLTGMHTCDMPPKWMDLPLDLSTPELKGPSIVT